MLKTATGMIIRSTRVVAGDDNPDKRNALHSPQAAAQRVNVSAWMAHACNSFYLPLMMSDEVPT